MSAVSVNKTLCAIPEVVSVAKRETSYIYIYIYIYIYVYVCKCAFYLPANPWEVSDAERKTYGIKVNVYGVNSREFRGGRNNKKKRDGLPRQAKELCENMTWSNTGGIHRVQWIECSAAERETSRIHVNINISQFRESWGGLRRRMLDIQNECAHLCVTFPRVLGRSPPQNVKQIAYTNF